MIASEHHRGRWLLQYAHQLIELHHLIAQKCDEGSEGDLLRDEMDHSWRKMSSEEVGVVRDLSADLYTITEPPLSNIDYSPDIAELISAAIKEGEWARALALIRKHASSIPSFWAAYQRGICWTGLGIDEAAAEFFACAVRLRPDRDELKAGLLASLLRSGRQNDALPIALEAVSSSTDISVLLQSAATIGLCAESASGPEAETLHRKLLEVTDSVMDRLAGAAPEIAQHLKHQIVVTHLNRAMSFAHIGLQSQAIDECKLAFDKEPGNLDAYMILGLLKDNDNTVAEPWIANARQRAAQRLVVDFSEVNTSQMFYQDFGIQ